MASAIDYHLSKAVRTYECDRQRVRQRGDHRKNKQPRDPHRHQTARFGCYGYKLCMNGGTYRAGREKLNAQKVALLHREAASYISHADDDGAENDWVADVSNSAGCQVDLSSILLCIAKPERKRRKKGVVEGFAKEFVIVPSVQHLDVQNDEMSESIYDFDWDDWVVLGAPPIRRSYSAAAHP